MTYAPKIVHNPGETEPTSIELNSAEITKRDLQAIASQAREAEREAKRQARENARSVLAAYDFDAAKTIIEGEAIPSAAKVVLKQAFDLLKKLKEAGE